MRSATPRSARNPLGHLYEPSRRRLVLDGRVADLPRRLGVPIPELKTALVAVDLARRQVERLAAGEVLRPVHRRPEDAVRTGGIERSSARVASRLMDAARLGRGLNIALPNKRPERADDPSARRPRGRAFGPGAYTGRAQRPLDAASAPRSVAGMEPDATYKRILSFAFMVTARIQRTRKRSAVRSGASPGGARCRRR